MSCSFAEIEEQLLEIVVEKFVSKKIYGVSLISSILMVYHLKYGQIIEGFKIFDYNKTFIRYYWIEVDGRVIDVNSAIYKRLKLCRPLYLQERLSKEDPGIEYFFIFNQETKKLEDAYQHILET